MHRRVFFMEPGETLEEWLYFFFFARMRPPPKFTKNIG